MTLTFECKDCGFQYEQGFDGSHDCIRRLKKDRRVLKDRVKSLEADLVKAQQRLAGLDTSEACHDCL